MHKLAKKTWIKINFAFFFVFSFINRASAQSTIFLLDNDNCNGIMDPEVLEFLQGLFDIFKYGGPLLCVVLTIIDFTKTVASQDKDSFTKTIKKTGKRIVLALLLFFIPSLINFVFDILGWSAGTCGIG